MYKVVMVLTSLFTICIVSQEIKYEGEACITRTGHTGVCVKIRYCQSAIRDISKMIFPQTCSFAGNEPIVCCIDLETTTEPARNTTRMLWTNPTSTEAPTTTIGAQSKFAPEQQDPYTAEVPSCPPISPKKTAPKTGQKAWDKCIEYQEQLVYPCEDGQEMRVNNCWNDINTFILGGTDAFEGEFPHMALIGYGDDPDALMFLCGGTLISDRFILTAGHCYAANRDLVISHVLLGTLKKSDYNKSNLYQIKSVHIHPQYKPPIKYNDIALLETLTPIKLNGFTVPACLDVADALVEGDSAIATGWGKTSLRGDTADIMQKVTLKKFSDKRCSSRYVPSRLIKKGFDPTTQLCFGDDTESSDTCQGDSGGPLQIKNERIHCMYTVIGITSFGRSCGMIGEPALYTKVSHYVPWIESVVWPDE